MSTASSEDTWMASSSDVMRNAMQSRRLAPQVPHLIPILDELPEGAVVCEVGCGPGGITLDIAQRYPRLRVLGMDIDAKSIKLAQDAANQTGVQNLHYSVGDALKLSELAAQPNFEAIEGGCHLIYSHAAIMHTPDALTSIKQMKRATIAGGTISLTEGDSGLFYAYPEVPGMQKLLEVFPRIGAAKGADTLLGRKLISHGLAAGYARDDITRHKMSESTVSSPMERAGLAKGFAQIFADVGSKPEMMKAANVTSEDITSIRKGLEEWSKCEDGICSFISMTVVCVDSGGKKGN
ncbi:uncharacterized protein RHO25_003724 [Cercospora beticola]|uniref:Methyltransferase domain-containing protein n=2 Tax=Cercospora beticola TaxID=122368 RepID=A0ABZ0NHU4_CERBT|nr:hypothetical protein RHO25_003724 [Cercospora beticola]CAK1360419.1 unnamed protein product [Cercospora beticola]